MMKLVLLTLLVLAATEAKYKKSKKNLERKPGYIVKRQGGTMLTLISSQDERSDSAIELVKTELHLNYIIGG